MKLLVKQKPWVRRRGFPEEVAASPGRRVMKYPGRGDWWLQQLDLTSSEESDAGPGVERGGKHPSLQGEELARRQLISGASP